jgi:hypothetical protein
MATISSTKIALCVWYIVGCDDSYGKAHQITLFTSATSVLLTQV